MNEDILVEFSNRIDTLHKIKFGGYKPDEVENLFGGMLAALHEVVNELKEKTEVLKQLKANTGSVEETNIYRTKLSEKTEELNAVKEKLSVVEKELLSIRNEKRKRDEEVSGLIVELEKSKKELEKLMGNTTTDASIISDTLIMATRTAEEWRAKAKAESESMILAAKNEALKINEEAKRKASKILSDANAKVSAVIEAAEVVSEGFSRLGTAISVIPEITSKAEEMTEMLR